MTATELAAAFFLAMLVILLVCRGVAWAAGKVGQPAVVGEMVAGVLLGPSLLGLVAPGVEHFVFPEEVRPVLYVVGQVGLVAFMLQAGYEFRSHANRQTVLTASTVSAVGVLLPLALGTAVAWLAHGHVRIFQPGVPVGITAVFTGVTLAITAFPMLARIITERGLSGTRFGRLSLASGALDDVAAWCMLAGVLSVTAGRAWPVLQAIGGGLLFGAVVWWLLRPSLARILGNDRTDHATRVMLVVAVLFAAAWFTDEIGLYAVFGAFVIGMILPTGPASGRLVQAISGTPRVVFLPVFFVSSGLNTRIGLLGDPALLVFSLVIILTAIVGKFGGCWLAARWRGETVPDAARVGALMNARGLMQLVALDVGLSAGLVNGQLFTALVLVALVTTVMTAPVLSWIDRRDPLPAAPEPTEPESGRTDTDAPTSTEQERR